MNVTEPEGQMKMKILGSLTLAAALMAATASADTLLFDDFQNLGQASWVAGGRGAVGTSEDGGNGALRLTAGATATKVVSTQGYKDVTVAVSFAALDLGPHGSCFADVSADEGATWTRIFRIGRGQDSGMRLYPGSQAVAELDNKPHVTLRLTNSGSGEANCWADNIQVTATATGGPRAAESSAPGSVVWDPNSVK
jgi:hypothetical protein